MHKSDYPRFYRIVKRIDYAIIQARGKRFSTNNFIILVLKKESGTARLGIVASRKVGCAVERNRVKRLLREIFRRNLILFPPRTDFCIIARRSACNLNFYLASREILNVVQHIAAIEKNGQTNTPQIN